MTVFQERVYRELRKVPRGRVITYKSLADAVGCGSPRAVGQALRVNPYAPDVPCHRVIASDLTIGGFMGAKSGTEIEKKRKLLESEGICFSEGGKLRDGALIWPKS
jgi:methylated-DNA-[protein]-cysteine S-methyltransferase